MWHYVAIILPGVSSALRNTPVFGEFFRYRALNLFDKFQTASHGADFSFVLWSLNHVINLTQFIFSLI